MRHIAYIANIRLPTEKAHGLQIMKTCEALAPNLKSLDLIVPRRLNPLKEDPFIFYSVKRNFAIKKLWCLDFIAFPFFKTLGFWLENIIFAWVATVYASINRYSIYYTRDFLTALLFTLLSRSVIYEIHIMPEHGLFWHKCAWRRCRKLIVISEGIKQELLQKGVSENKITVVRDAVDFNQFNISLSKEDCRKKLNLALDKKIILYTGHFYKWKGTDTLFDTARFFGENVLFIFVGGTNKDIQDIRHGAQDTSNILIIGHRPHQEIPLWLRAADILVLPNSAKYKISKFYTSPMKLFEYMASGTPIIISDLPAMREILSDNDALFFTPDDSNALAQAIKEGLGSYDELNAKAQSALIEAKNYTWENRALSIMDAIS